MKFPNHEEPPKTFGSLEVANLAKITLRQLQWWDERRLVSPNQVRHCRIYQFDELVEMMVIAELRRKGYSLQRIRGLIRLFKRRFVKALSKDLAGDPFLHLITDGKSIQLESDEDKIIEILKQARSGMAIVSVNDQIRLIDKYFWKQERASVSRGLGVTAPSARRASPGNRLARGARA
jgi:DNA-binding transcriptional MerR regulator